MRRRQVVRVVVAGLLSTALAGGLMTSLPAGAATGPATGGKVVTATATYQTTDTEVTIATRDGVQLAAKVWSPKGASGKRPLVLIPSAWGGESGQMFWASEQLAKRGFVAVNYATRGFQDSEGLVDAAGPKDISDVSDLIDWAVKSANADAGHVAMFGLSYGAGLALLASAYEPRLKAIGSLEGFTDLTRTGYPNQTRSQFMIAGLLFGAVIAGKLSPEVEKHFNTLLTGKQATGTEIAQAIDFLKNRSPLNLVDRINANKPAIFMATSWNDTAYGTDQISEFYNRLTTTKRLEVRPGDHVVNEVPGAVGVGPATDMYAHLFDWITTYAGATDTALVHQAPIWMQPRSSGSKPATETYTRWSDLTKSTRKANLTPGSGFFAPTGSMTAGAATTWTATLKQGGDIAGGLGIPVTNFGQEALGLKPPQVMLWAADRQRTAVFVGPKETAGLKLRGNTTLSLNIVPSSAKGTIVVYLYDTDAGGAGGTGYLVSHRPYTWLDATPGKPLAITLPLQPTAYNLPAGHHLAVAVSTGDPIYSNENPQGSTIKLVSSPQAPITISTELG